MLSGKVMCYSLIFGVNVIFLETKFLNNIRMFLFPKPKFRIPLYLYLVINFFLIIEVEKLLDKNQRANCTEILFKHLSFTGRPTFRERGIDPHCCDATQRLKRWLHTAC
jgi:hypothetical protein